MDALGEMKSRLRANLAAGRKKISTPPAADEMPRSTCPHCGNDECYPVRWPVVRCECGCVWTHVE